jgi:prefoldin beta subunit
MGGRRGARAPGGDRVKEISPQLQNQIAQYQQLQNQLQVLASQRVQMEAKLREIEGTLEELNKLTGDTPVYKSIGMLLIRQDDREALKKELEEHKETLTIRVKSLQKQEKSLSGRYEDLAGKIQAALGTSPATAEGN